MKAVRNQGKSILEKDQENVWHHISKYNDKSHPLIAKEAKGSWIIDYQGNKYLDGMSGLWCVNVGYGREVLAKAAYEQMNQMAYMSMTQSHIPGIELADKLNELLDDDYMFFYSNSGSDANEVAFKIARQYHEQKGDTSRYKIISRYRAYHGSSMGALSATGQPLRKYKFEPLTAGFLHVAPPDNYRKSDHLSIEEYNLQQAKAIEDTIIWEQEETIAAVIMEPIITGGGILIPDPVYVKAVQDICRRHGVLLIIDEVICGFGRTGRMFGHMNYDIKPDIITMAKGLTSAYLPLSVTAVRKDIYEVFTNESADNYFRHVNTFGGNPAACAVALKNIEIMEEENLTSQSAVLGEHLKNELQELNNHSYVGDIRGIGLLLGIELVEDKTSKQPAKPERVAKIIKECKDHGLIIGKNGDTVAGFNNIITLCPPLSITDDELEFMIAIIKQVFEANETSKL
ncbi:aspartate aminotransferase family protein [Virgibacillus salexigens]|uniref:aspartate aminotransferase family protein n=1 Tax=Virgibacillus massiliensis TaxID=1462526 RepID=UPI00136BCDA8|nr:aspartate aminotransferase family protein [Virgibacillus massiliensis]MYL42484.1 aminotransferase class III-fold pyridoxal phosphate-dependent enzyme [Virgibacillus massiliensis]